MKNIKTQILTILVLLLTLPIFAQTTTSTTALSDYLHNEDSTFSWTVKEQSTIGECQMYNLKLTSQTWRDIEWTHQVVVLLPSKVTQDEALLMINSGNNADGEPKWLNSEDNQLLKSLSLIAQDNQMCVALLQQTPNQPLYSDLYEDALISYTLHNFQSDGDYSWPLLFPMVKSAVKAMDCVEQFTDEKTDNRIDKFIVTGASKRGWTTWLTGANDNRVIAIAPMVIDILNIKESLNYQVEAYQEYSPMINDYANLGLLDEVSSGKGKEVIDMIDPYSYRTKLTMPKYVIMATNDPYWVVDNVKNYYYDLPTETMLNYTPNAGHNMGGWLTPLNNVNGFVSNLLSDAPMPVCTWKTEVNKDKLTIKVKSEGDNILRAEMWSANSEKHDFREAEWSKTELELTTKNSVKQEITLPSDGYGAFYINFIYKAPNGREYSTSTRVFIINPEGIV